MSGELRNPSEDSESFHATDGDWKWDLLGRTDGPSLDVLLTADVKVRLSLLPEPVLAGVGVRQTTIEAVTAPMADRLARVRELPILLFEYVLAQRAFELPDPGRLAAVCLAERARSVLDSLNVSFPPGVSLERDPFETDSVRIVFRRASHLAALTLRDLPDAARDPADHALRRSISDVIARLRRDATPATDKLLTEAARSWPSLPPEDLPDTEPMYLEDVVPLFAHLSNEVSGRAEQPTEDLEMGDLQSLDLVAVERAGLVAPSERLTVRKIGRNGYPAWQLQMTVLPAVAEAFRQLQSCFSREPGGTAAELGPRTEAPAVAVDAEGVAPVNRRSHAAQDDLILAYGRLYARVALPYSLAAMQRNLDEVDRWPPYLPPASLDLELDGHRARFAFAVATESGAAEDTTMVLVATVPPLPRRCSVSLGMSERPSSLYHQSATEAYLNLQLWYRGRLPHRSERWARDQLARVKREWSEPDGLVERALDNGWLLHREGVQPETLREAELLEDRIRDAVEMTANELEEAVRDGDAEKVAELCAELWKLRSYLGG